MKIWHLFHSGVLVETDHEQLFFDVISDIDGFVDSRKKQYFFVSHMHSDHFDFERLSPYLSKATFILSDEAVIREAFKNCNQVIYVKPNESYDDLSFRVTTYDSTDLGVSFMVELDHKYIFHSGDLNWWHWENSPPDVQADEARQFNEILSSIKEPQIDVAFVPVDPRLKDAYYYAAKAFIENKRLGYLVPMHFNTNYGITKDLYDLLKNDLIVKIETRNSLLFSL